MIENQIIPLAMVIAFLTEGWNIVPMSMPHGQYSAFAWRRVAG